MEVRGKKMIKENIRYNSGMSSKPRFKQFVALPYIGMPICKRIDAAVHPDAIGNLFGIIQVLVALHIVADEIAQFDFVRFAR